MKHIKFIIALLSIIAITISITSVALVIIISIIITCFTGFPYELDTNMIILLLAPGNVVMFIITYTHNDFPIPPNCFIHRWIKEWNAKDYKFHK